MGYLLNTRVSTLRGVTVVMGGGPVVDRGLGGDCDVSDAVVEGRCSQQGSVCLHVIVAL